MKLIFNILFLFGLTIGVNAQITVGFSSSTACEFSNVTLKSTSFDNSTDSIIKTVWDLDNDGLFNDAVGDSAKFLFGGSGKYQIGVKVYSSSKDSAQQYNNITVYKIPIANFTASNTCLGDSLMVTSTSNFNGTNPGSYEWYFDNSLSTKITTNSGNHMFTSSGTHKIRLTVSNDKQCKGTVEKNIEVYPYPIADFTFKNPCLGDSLELTSNSTINNGGIAKYYWDLNNDMNFMDDSTSSAKSLNSSTGNWTIRHRAVSNFGCTHDTFKVVTVTTKPIVNFIVNSECTKQPLKIDNLSFSNVGTLTYNWNFNNEDFSTTFEPKHGFNLSGEKTITLTATNQFNCSDSILKKVTILESPTANFDVKDVCDKEAVNLEFKGSGNTKNTIWNFGDGTTKVGSKVNHTYADSGKYQIQLIAVNLLNCYDTLTKEINVWEKPSNEIISNNGFEFCKGDSVILSAKNTNHNILWSTGSTNKNIVVKDSKTVTLVTYTSKACQTVLDKKLTQNPLPSIDAGNNVYLSLGEDTQLVAKGDFETILWIDEKNNSLSSNKTLYLKPNETLKYFANTTSNKGCKSSDSIVVFVNKNYDLKAYELISPNEDGKNDFWIIENILEYPESQVQIFDRWGKLIYESYAYKNDWAGTDLNGKKLPNGAYYYVITNKNINKTWTGAISIYR